MDILLALAILFGLLAALWLFQRWRPLIFYRHGGSTSNWLFHIRVDVDKPYPIARTAQEIYEQPRLLWYKLTGQMRELQLRSHAVECFIAATWEGANHNVYILDEATRMHGAISRSYGELKGMTQSDIATALYARMAGAGEWVTKNRPILRREEERIRRALGQ